MPEPIAFPEPRKVTQEELDRDPVLRALLAAGDNPGPIGWPWDVTEDDEPDPADELTRHRVRRER
ncbi:MAG TPA: hypothetical protein VHL09_17405 [Dehalococcoidia bacterium]|nr:hypothetical protein [Dehalococcoidia bacterium]